MAIEIRVDPLDFEYDVAIGVDLPLMGKVGSKFALNYTSLDQAYANAKNLLLTNQGERVMLPNFGCDLKRSIFEPNTSLLAENVEAKIRNQFEYWLPYVFINELVVNRVPDEYKLLIQMTISLSGNQLDTRSITLEVNLNG